MQQIKVHHSRDNTPEIIIIEIPERTHELVIHEEPITQPEQQHRQTSEEREEVRYSHKMKLAIVGLATTLVAGGTAVIVFLTK